MGEKLGRHYEKATYFSKVLILKRQKITKIVTISRGFSKAIPGSIDCERHSAKNRALYLWHIAAQYREKSNTSQRAMDSPEHGM